MSLSHGREGRLARYMKTRGLLKPGDKAAEPVLLRSASAVLRAARNYPPGPSFVSSLWTGGADDRDRETDDAVPSLVVVVVTRVTPWGALIPAFALVDRTCLGVKKAHVDVPRTQAELEGDLDVLAKAHGPLVECPLLVAQSIVFNAIDYARSLGFEPHADFPADLFGPRPAELLDTPFSRPAYPIYIVGPGDPVERILDTLDRAVGSFNYSFMSSEPLSAEGSVLLDARDMTLGLADDDHAPAAAG